MASATPGSAVETLIDSDVILEWAVLVAARWLDSNSLDAFGPKSPPDAVRAAVLSVVTDVAAVMALSAARAGGESCRDEAILRHWLLLCVDDIAQPDLRTDPARLIDSFEPSRPVATAPLRRWNSACREHMLAAGLGWLRGRHLDESRFQVARVGALWTVVEHGALDASPVSVHEPLVRAAADAVVRHSRPLGQEPPEPETLVQHLLADARRYCAAAENAVPPFALRTPGVS